MKATGSRPQRIIAIAVVIAATAIIVAHVLAQSATSLGKAQLISPEELVRIIRSSGTAKPLILNVGPRFLYLEAHIPGAEYMGAAAEAEGIQQLRKRAKSLPHNKSIVLYCGCCPWIHCPNVAPAFKELHAMGFTNVKVLYIANNFGSDWVEKGYPVTRGQ